MRWPRWSAARNESVEIQRVLDAASVLDRGSSAQRAIVLGLGAGLQRSSNSLENIRTKASAEAVAMLGNLVEQAAKIAADAAAESDQREQAVRLLGCAGGDRAYEVLAALVGPRQGEALQVLAVRTLARFGEPTIAKSLIGVWRRCTPTVQEEIIVALASRGAWAAELLDACVSDQISVGQVTRATRTALLNHQDPALRELASMLFDASSSPRDEVIGRYQAALALSGDATRGDKVYERECTACHRLGERGFSVGPNLALIRNRTPAALLEAILDPNREVQPRYVNFVVVDDSGRTVTGLITAETANSVTLAPTRGQPKRF